MIPSLPRVLIGDAPAGHSEWVRDFIMEPKHPLFPRASIAVGRWASVLYNVMRWLGLGPGPFGRPLLWLSFRRTRAEWAASSLETRVQAMVLLGAAGFAGLISFASWKCK
jgi:hypothetical protein